MKKEMYTRDSPKNKDIEDPNCERKKRYQKRLIQNSNRKKIISETIVPDKTLITTSNSDKLKSELGARESYRKKLRHGKAEFELNEHDKRKALRRKRRQKKLIYKQAAMAALAAKRLKDAQEEQRDRNAAEDVVRAGVYTVARPVRFKQKDKHRLSEKASNSQYGKKLHNKNNTRGSGSNSGALSVSKGGVYETAEGSNIKSRLLQRESLKKEIQKKAVEENAERVTKSAGKIAEKGFNAFAEKMGDLGKYLYKLISENLPGLFSIAMIAMAVIIVAGAVSSCSMMAGGIENISIATSFTADDDQILAVDADYTNLETQFRQRLQRINSEYPGYDEYRHYFDEVGHNPFELAALLTVLYEDYTRSQVQPMLQQIFSRQYVITTVVKVETRTRPVYNPETGQNEDQPYNYYIIEITEKNYSIDYVARHMGLSADQLARYELLLTTFGNKKYLFEDSIYAHPDQGDDYTIPPEFLTDEQFANMIREAQNHLGTPYVWGGYSPSGFDCSGFVSWVINHCGNGWNIGRKTANGLLSKCTRIDASEAKPGDLIFFQGTYATNGASHVGIYVGNGMMIHCGNPVQYSSVNKTYWQNHFYTYGRLNL